MLADRPTLAEAAPAARGATDATAGADGTGLGGRAFLLTWAACWAPMAVWWLALLPGGMSADSLSSWYQIVTGTWYVAQPPPFTAFMWVTSGAGTTPATTSLAQTLVVSAALAFLVTTLAQVVGGARWVRVATLALLVLPLFGPFSVMLWKDIPEAAALFVIAALVLRASSGTSAPRRGWWLALAGASLAAALFRWNGVATVIVAAVVAVVALPRPLRVRAPVAMVVAAAIGFGTLLATPHVTAVRPLETVDTMGMKLADIAQYARNSPHDFRRYDRRVLRQVAPFWEWQRAGYTCFTVDPATFGLIRYQDRLPRLDAAAPALDRLWRRLVKHDPGRLFLARGCRAALAWSPIDPTGTTILTLGAARHSYRGVASNDIGVRSYGPGPLRRAAARYAGLSLTRWFQEVFWRPAVWVLALVIVFLVACRRLLQRRMLAALLAVPLGMLVSFAAEPPAQDARYLYPAVVLCQLAVAALLGRWWSARRAQRAGDGAAPLRETAA